MKRDDFFLLSKKPRELLKLLNSLHVKSYEYMGSYIKFYDKDHEIVYRLYALSYPDIKYVPFDDRVRVCTDDYMLFVLYILMFSKFTGIFSEDIGL